MMAIYEDAKFETSNVMLNDMLDFDVSVNVIDTVLSSTFDLLSSIF